MKAILVVDKPNNCGNCPCAGEEFGICQADEKNRDCDWYKIPSWCPLKPLPEKNTWGITKNGHVTEYAEGWNACLEEIEK